MSIEAATMTLQEIMAAIDAAGVFVNAQGLLDAGMIVIEEAGTVGTAIATTGGQAIATTSTVQTALQIAQSSDLSATGEVVKSGAVGALATAGGFKLGALLSVDVGVIAGACAPLLGVSLGAGLYDLNPKLWTDISAALLPFCYQGTIKIPAWVTQDTETGLYKFLVDKGIIPELKRVFELNDVPVNANYKTIKSSDLLVEPLICGDGTVVFEDDVVWSTSGAATTCATGTGIKLIVASETQGATATLTRTGQDPLVTTAWLSFTHNGLTVYYGSAVHGRYNKGVVNYATPYNNDWPEGTIEEIAWTAVYGNRAAPTFPEGTSIWNGEPAPEIVPDYPETPIRIIPRPYPLEPDVEPIPVTPITPFPVPETPIIPFPTPVEPDIDPTPEKPDNWPEEEPWPEVIPFPYPNPDPETHPDWPEVIPWPLPDDPPTEWPTVPDGWPEFPPEIPWPSSPDDWPEEVPWPEEPPPDWPPEEPWPDNPDDWPEGVPWPVPWPEGWPDNVPWPPVWPEELPYPIPFPSPAPSPDPAQDPEPGEITDPQTQIEPYIEPTPQPYPSPDPDPDPDPTPDPREDPTEPSSPTDPYSPILPDPTLPFDPLPNPNPDPEIPPSEVIPSPVPIIPLPYSAQHGLICVYHPTQAQLLSFANWLWVTYQDATIEKIWNNPFDGVISLFELYCTPNDVGHKNIKSGFLDSGIDSNYISRYVSINCGSIGIPEFYGNYFDYSPYSKAHIYLPFIGMVELNVDDIVGHGVNVEYRIDCYNGSCIAIITIGKSTTVNGATVDYTTIMYQFSGNCSVELPLTGGSQASIKAGMMEAAAYGLSSVIGGIVSGAGSLSGALSGAASGLAYGAAHAVSSVVSAKSSVQHSGSFGSSFGAMGNKKPFIVVTRPKQIQVQGYEKLYGFPAHKMVTIGSCTGYVRCREVHVHSNTATENEKELIERLLKEGVYISD